jgi:penicillin V acylase-like amidase (Ntn superfamily)
MSAGGISVCTRILWNDNEVAVVASRTMDWPEPTEPVLTAFPRGSRHDGGAAAGKKVVAGNALSWESAHGTVVVTFYGIGAVDGINEHGLAAHLLYLGETDFGRRNPEMPGLVAGLWVQYALDQAASVSEALALLAEVQVVMMEARGTKATVHLALEDAAGDSAIIEHLDGTMVVHHGPQYRIMTNDPAYDEQLRLLDKLDFSHPSGDMPLPGNVNARDRFQRASYFSALLPVPQDERAAAAGVLAIARNVSVPFGAPYSDFGIYDTEYRTVCDLTNRCYYFELTTAPNVIWAELDELHFEPGAPVMTLDPDDIALSGEVSGVFQASKAPY